MYFKRDLLDKKKVFPLHCELARYECLHVQLYMYILVHKKCDWFQSCVYVQYCTSVCLSGSKTLVNVFLVGIFTVRRVFEQNSFPTHILLSSTMINGFGTSEMRQFKVLKCKINVSLPQMRTHQGKMSTVSSSDGNRKLINRCDQSNNYSSLCAWKHNSF